MRARDARTSPASPALLPVGAAPASLEFRAPLLGIQATQLGRARRLRGTPRDRRSQRRPQDLAEALARGGAVAALGTSLGGRDREDGSGESLAEHRQGTLALLVVEGARRSKVQAELYPRVRGVDPLPSGARGVRKALDQLPRGHDKAARAARPGRYTQIVHALQCASGEARCLLHIQAPTVAGDERAEDARKIRCVNVCRIRRTLLVG